MVYSLVGNGFTVWSWGTTTDENGVDTGMDYDPTCVLCGVSGDLSKGEEPGVGLCGPNGRPSEAVTRVSFDPDSWRVVGHGGACGPQVGSPIQWIGNPVNAQATCFYQAGNLEGYWTPDRPSIDVIEGYDVLPGRQCFLSGIVGVEQGSWDSPNTYARIRSVSIPDATHPVPGWYIESNLQKSALGSNPMIQFICVDFPTDNKITSGTTAIAKIPQTIKLTTGTGVKACALTGIQGAFKYDSWNDGVVMNFPSQLTGDWSLTLTAGKSASWVCVK
jgi:hypothetical protein